MLTVPPTAVTLPGGVCERTTVGRKYNAQGTARWEIGYEFGLVRAVIRYALLRRRIGIAVAYAAVT